MTVINKMEIIIIAQKYIISALRDVSDISRDVFVR